MALLCLHDCPICLDIIPHNDFFQTECKHIFHYSCIHIWYESKSSCPNCRMRLSNKRKYNTETALYIPVQFWWPDAQITLYELVNL